MTNDITQLMSPTLLFMLFCYFITLGIRKGFELWKPSLAMSTIWTDFLPVIPVVVGTAIAYIPKYPIPAAFVGSIWSKGMWGFVAGALSTWAYAILQAVFKRLFGFDIGNLTRSGRPGPVRGIAPIIVPPPPPLPTDTKPGGK
jgi:hypothetical protein